MNVTNMTVEQIIARIEDYRLEGFNVDYEICVCLAELKRRKETHPLHRHKTYRWCNEVATGKLFAGAAAMFGGRAAYIEHILGRPMELQKQIVAGVAYDVVYEWEGQIKQKRETTHRMNMGTFMRLFPKGQSPATVSQQTEALKKEIAARPKNVTKHGPIVRADKAAGMLFVGTTQVPLSVVKTALLEIGFDITAVADLDPILA